MEREEIKDFTSFALWLVRQSAEVAPPCSQEMFYEVSSNNEIPQVRR